MIFSQTRTLRIFGSQDYLVCVQGGIPSEAGDELNALTNPMLREHGYFGILHIAAEAGEPGLKIHPIYDGNWSFAVAPDEEDGAYPNWPVRRAWGTLNAHSETLEIEVPKSARLHVLPPVESEAKTED